MSSLSIVIPLYNKGDQIKNTLQSIDKKCKELNLIYEILIIENESTDNSLIKATEWLDKNQSIAEIHSTAKGMGNAVKLGILESKYDYITLIPADYTFGESELEYFQKYYSIMETMLLDQEP